MKTEHLTEVKQILKQHQFKKLFSGDTENTFIQFFRYCFVGGFATVVDWGLSLLLFYWVFSRYNFPFIDRLLTIMDVSPDYAILSNGLSFVAGLLANYFLSTFWIFKQSKMQNRFLEFLSFAAIGVVGLLLTIGITKGFAWALADVTSLYQILSKVVSTAVAFFWNFFARKYLLYTKKEA